MQVLGFDLLKSGIFSVLPWITMAVFANVGGWLADSMVSKGVSVTTVRKVMQTVRLTYHLISKKESISIISCNHFWMVSSITKVFMEIADLGNSHNFSAFFIFK